jgi:hypothetical protein
VDNGIKRSTAANKRAKETDLPCLQRAAANAHRQSCHTTIGRSDTEIQTAMKGFVWLVAIEVRRRNVHPTEKPEAKTLTAKGFALPTPIYGEHPITIGRRWFRHETRNA